MAFGVGNPGFGSVDGLDNLRNAIAETGQSIPASVKIGASSGVEGNGRELTAGEALWKQRNAESTAAYNERKAGREERRMQNMDPNDPRMRESARAQNVHVRRAAEASGVADEVKGARANNAAQMVRRIAGTRGANPNPLARLGRENGVGQKKEETFADKANKLLSEAVGKIKNDYSPEKVQELLNGAIEGIVSMLPSQKPPDAANPAPAPQPKPEVTTTTGTDGRTVASYVYGDANVELPAGVDASDEGAVEIAMGNNNQMLDWMSDEMAKWGVNA